MADKSLLYRIYDAVTDADCQLPWHLRHTVMVIAYAADWQTGEHRISQQVLAERIGISERSLRRHLTELDALAAKGSSPVRITRTARSAQTGRLADQWQIELTAVPRSARPPPPTPGRPTEASATQVGRVAPGSKTPRRRAAAKVEPFPWKS